MLPDRVSNPGPLTYESGALPIALRGPATDSADVWILRLKICSVVLLPALNPACSSAIISSAWDLRPFKMTFKMTVLE